MVRLILFTTSSDCQTNQEWKKQIELLLARINIKVVPLVMWCFATFVISSHAERSDWVLGVLFQFVPFITPEVQNFSSLVVTSSTKVRIYDGLVTINLTIIPPDSGQIDFFYHFFWLSDKPRMEESNQITTGKNQHQSCSISTLMFFKFRHFIT